MAANTAKVRKVNRAHSTHVAVTTISNHDCNVGHIHHNFNSHHTFRIRHLVKGVERFGHTQHAVFQISITTIRHLVQFKFSFNVQRMRYKVMKSLLLIARSFTNVRFSRALTRKISSFLIVHYRSSNNTDTISNIRRFRGTRQYNQVRVSDELINRRGLQVIRVHSHGNRALYLATKGLIQVIIFLANRASDLRRFQRWQFSNKATYTGRFGHRHRVLPCHFIIRRFMVLRSGASKAAMVQRLP